MTDFAKNTWVEVEGWNYPTFVVGDSTKPDHVNVYTSEFLGPKNSIEELHVSQISTIKCPPPFSQQHEKLLDDANNAANNKEWSNVYDIMNEIMEHIIDNNHPEYNT